MAAVREHVYLLIKAFTCLKRTHWSVCTQLLHWHYAFRTKGVTNACYADAVDDVQ